MKRSILVFVAIFAIAAQSATAAPFPRDCIYKGTIFRDRVELTVAEGQPIFYSTEKDWQTENVSLKGNVVHVADATLTIEVIKANGFEGTWKFGRYHTYVFMSCQ